MVNKPEPYLRPAAGKTTPLSISTCIYPFSLQSPSQTPVKRPSHFPSSLPFPLFSTHFPSRTRGGLDNKVSPPAKILYKPSLIPSLYTFFFSLHFPFFSTLSPSPATEGLDNKVSPPGQCPQREIFLYFLRFSWRRDGKQQQRQ